MTILNHFMYEENKNHVDIIDVDIAKKELVLGNWLNTTLTKIGSTGVLESDNDILALMCGGI